MNVAVWPLIEIDGRGMAYIQGTRMKVIMIALDRIAYGWDADEIQRQHPHLSLGQIHTALAFYYEHKAECDAQIEARSRMADEIRARTENSELQQKLRALNAGQ
jgi:uncharacterized protein (DUF433 family)